MTAPPKHHRAPSILPAQLSFLAIYNPTLGPTDETFADQLVFWYSRKASEARRAEKSGGDVGADASARRKAAEREEENERLRQIGLAQGMVGFAKTFSEGEAPVDSVETEKSRVVLKELESGWWILASVDLTRLPSSATTAAGSGKGEEGAKSGLEYSSREVSPPALLVEQLLQAHSVFLLHHGPSLDELFVKLSRAKFCNTLERYWTRFARSWDVLLHGNPAVDALNGIKLAAGGELGVGVGEEEWGSGEREVLEDLTRRTEGLVDMVVARYGDSATSEEDSAASETEVLPWLGSGNTPTASDGIVFGGLDQLSRHSLRGLSLWMQQIYAYGDHAYGVRDNPHRERRKRRRRNAPQETNGSSESPRLSRQLDARELRQKVQQVEASRTESPSVDQDMLPKDPRPHMYDRVASHDHATGTSTPQTASHPDIPPPIVSAAEQALNRATKGADNKSTKEPAETDTNTTMGIPDQYMKYMTFGLSSLAKSYTKKQPESSRTPSEDSINPKLPQKTQKSKLKTASGKTKDDKASLSHVDPSPEGEELRGRIAQQVQAENEGHFVVGLKGVLEAKEDEGEGDDASMTEGSLQEESGGPRTLLRILQVKVKPTEQTYAQKLDEDLAREDTGGEPGHLLPENPAMKDLRRLRVLIYVHRPFIFAFLFEQRTSSLSYAGLYKSLHATLKPIHKRLLASTSPEAVAQRLQTSHPNKDPPIFSLLYDPPRLSLHSTIPNIPPPGVYEPWTRLEALNVHAAILASLAATEGPKGETALERSSKTSRGWWVVWLRLPPSVASDEARPEGDSQPAESGEESSEQLDSQGGAISTLGLASSLTPRAKVKDTHRIAVLVRKATVDAGAGQQAQGKAGAGGRMASGMLSSLGMRAGSGNAAGGNGGGEDSGAGALGGFGVDARKYVEGLLSLNR